MKKVLGYFLVVISCLFGLVTIVQVYRSFFLAYKTFFLETDIDGYKIGYVIWYFIGCSLLYLLVAWLWQTGWKLSKSQQP